MSKSRNRTVLVGAAVSVAVALAFPIAAHAKVYAGAWDPEFGVPFSSGTVAPFTGLGWNGSSTFSIDDSCLSGSGWIYSGCGMKLESAVVNFYNLSDPSTILQTLSFVTLSNPVTAVSMFVSGGDVTGIQTGLMGPLPGSGVSALTLGQTYNFELQFANPDDATQQVFLYYATLAKTPFLPSCGVPANASCGYSNPPTGVPVMTITPVPEPTTYALMLAGIGAVGFVARRRRT